MRWVTRFWTTVVLQLSVKRWVLLRPAQWLTRVSRTVRKKGPSAPDLLVVETRVWRTASKRNEASSSWAWSSCLTYCEKKRPSQLFLGLKLVSRVLLEKGTKPALLGLETRVSRKAVCNTAEQLPIKRDVLYSFNVPHKVLGVQFRSPVPLSTLLAFPVFPLKPPESVNSWKKLIKIMLAEFRIN